MCCLWNYNLVYISKMARNLSLALRIQQHLHTSLNLTMIVRINSKEPEFTVSAENQTRIHGSLSVGEVVRNFSLRSFLFICKTTDDPELNKLQQHAGNATKKAVNAFELLMAGGRSFPDKKRSRYVSNYKQSTLPCIQFHGHFIYRYQAANVGYIFVSILKRDCSTSNDFKY